MPHNGVRHYVLTCSPLTTPRPCAGSGPSRHPIRDIAELTGLDLEHPVEVDRMRIAGPSVTYRSAPPGVSWPPLVTLNWRTKLYSAMSSAHKSGLFSWRVRIMSTYR